MSSRAVCLSLSTCPERQMVTSDRLTRSRMRWRSCVSPQGNQKSRTPKTRLQSRLAGRAVRLGQRRSAPRSAEQLRAKRRSHAGLIGNTSRYLTQMCDVSGPCHAAGWAEGLGPGCPLDGADNCSGEVVYRLFKKRVDPRENGSRHARNPDRHFDDGADPCRERALSVWSSRERCDKLGALPSNRNRVTKRLVLQPGWGAYKPFENDSEHWSWWRCGATDPARHAKEVK